MYFDIGTNIGKWAFANINDCEKIIAVEASPNTFRKLVSNINNHPKIICLNYAVCDSKDEYITFYNSDADTISTLNKDWLTSPNSRFYNHSNYNEIKCKTISLDKLIEIYGVPELVKIDVEGGEFETIKSLSQKINNLCFEWASETNEITIKCLEYLQTLGFSKFAIQYQDEYTYRPEIYTNVEDVKNLLNKTTPKMEWGMIWAK